MRLRGTRGLGTYQREGKSKNEAGEHRTHPLPSNRRGWRTQMSKVTPEMRIQAGLELAGEGLKSIWMCLPAWCNLFCEYCFACGGKAKPGSMEWADYERLLIEAKEMGVVTVGIPGSGEPFHPKNRELTLKVLRKCADLDMFVTLFTTGEFITHELAAELLDLPVEIMIKCNSLDSDLQNRFVSSKDHQVKHYGQRRSEVLQMLQDMGFNRPDERFGRKSRLAIVTSIMVANDESGLSNYDEMADLLRYARQRNVIFDVDTVLHVGRGATCVLQTTDLLVKAKVLELREIDRIEFGVKWEPGPGYVGGVACNRRFNHRYIDDVGNIHPCVGAVGIDLGNFKAGATLRESWESDLARKLREEPYKGECASCKRFSNKNRPGDKSACYSCYGRFTCNADGSLLTNEGAMKDGVHTTGCLYREATENDNAG